MRILLLFLCISCFAESERIIYQKIMSLNPKLNERYVVDLAKHLKRYGELYRMGHDVSLAISKKVSNLEFKHRTRMVHINGMEHKVISHYGPFQLDYDTVRQYNIDPTRLESDLEYNVHAHYRILRKKIDLCTFEGIKDQYLECYLGR